MGGTVSALLWNFCYDPVFTAIEAATGATVDAYVDDCAILAVGPRQALAASVFLLASRHCAGLWAEGHSCCWLEALNPHTDTIAVGSRIPLTVACTADGWTSWRGVAPDMLIALFRATL